MTRLVRIDDWERALLAWHAAGRCRPFEWGVWDCALAAADAVRAITGHDPAADVRGRYSSARGALRVLRNSGFGDQDLAGAITARIGAPVDKPLRSRRGDVVLVDGACGPTLCVLLGASAWGPGPGGLMPVSMDRVFAAWRVG